MAAHALLTLALATHAVIEDGSPLRAGCESGDAVIAQLRRGDPVEIRFALAGSEGTCYKVSVRAGAESLQGYVSASALSGMEEFERQRRNAPTINQTSAPRAEPRAVRNLVAGAGGTEAAAKAVRLLENGQPVEALQVLETVLRSGRRDAGVLSLAGWAAYRSDDMRQAMSYWQQSLALSPNPAVERLYRMAEKEAAADTSGERLFGMQFVLRYDRNDMSAEVARSIVNLLDQEYLRISQQLGCRAEERIVAVAQTPEAYRKTTDAAEWSGGQYDGRIRVAIPDQRTLGEHTRRTFSHEIVHACMAGLGRWPAWLQEGLAQKLSGETLTSGRRAELKRALRENRIPRLSRLGQTWARLSTEHAATAYAVALAAVELFDENYSGLGARNFLRNPQMLPQITEDLDRRLRQ